MFDAETASLIRSAPPLEGVDPQLLPQELTGIYAELAALRLRAAQLREDPLFLSRIERISRIAAVYEAQVDDSINGDARRAAAFVAGTAYQILGRVLPAIEEWSDALSAVSIHPRVAAPLLFLIAEQSPDAREAARNLNGPRVEEVNRAALLESIEDLALERFVAILERAERLSRIRPAEDAPLSEQATQSLYGFCWAGLVQLVAQLLDQPIPDLSYPRFDTPQGAFDQVARLAVEDIQVPGDGGRLVSAYSGPRHIARLLKHVADQLYGAGISNLPVPAGANGVTWKNWLRHRAVTKPTLWPNHRRAVATGFLDIGNSAVLVLPTGGGKTTLSELKIAATLSSNRKVIFLVPTLALVDQLRDDLQQSFPRSLNHRDVSTDGDLVSFINGPELAAIEVMTPERLLAVLSFSDSDLTDVGLLVFDECHLLSPEGGGARSVDAMLCLLHALRRAPQADFLLLSAMLRNAPDVAAWLEDLTGRRCFSIVDLWKPSRQARGVLVYPSNQVVLADRLVRRANRAKRNKQPFNILPLEVEPFVLFGLHHAWVRDADADIRLVRISPDNVQLSYGAGGAAPNANEVSATIAIRAAAAGLKVIVFVNQANHAPATAKRMHAGIQVPGQLSHSENVLWQEIVAELGDAQHSLVRPTFPAQPHSGDMIVAERRLVESMFRKADGINIIVATPTLAQGMNLPAELAILAGTMRHGDDGRAPLERHEILNAAGRAGRAGHLANGTVIMVPEPVVDFELAGRPTAAAFDKLADLLPLNDQCVSINDPLTDLLDRIQAGNDDGADIRYFLSRLTAGAEEAQGSDQAITMMARSFAAFQARRANTVAEFEGKLDALRIAIDAEAQDGQANTMKIAAFSGMQVEPLTALAARILAEINNLPVSIVGWCEWLVDFFVADRNSYALLFGADVETVKAVTRRKKTG